MCTCEGDCVRDTVKWVRYNCMYSVCVGIVCVCVYVCVSACVCVCVRYKCLTSFSVSLCTTGELESVKSSE